MGTHSDSDRDRLLDNIYCSLTDGGAYPKNKAFAYPYNLILEGTIKHFIIWERYYSEKEITEVLKKSDFVKFLFIKNYLARIISRQAMKFS